MDSISQLPSQSSTPSFISPSLSLEQLSLPRPIRLGVLASGSGTNFKAIAQAINAGQLNATIPVLIYNNPEAKAAQRAENFGVPAILHNHRDFKRREDLDQAIVETLQNHEVDFVVMAGWMRLVTSVLLDAFPHRAINIHPSLLPSFKGTRAIEQALEAKVKITGCTVHIVSLEMDSGPILLQAAVPILPDDTSETLHQRIQIQEHRIFPLAIALAAQKTFGSSS